MTEESIPSPEAPLEPSYAPREAAEILGISYGALTRWAHEGLIDYVVYPNGRRRYKASVIRAMLEKGVETP